MSSSVFLSVSTAGRASSDTRRNSQTLAYASGYDRFPCILGQTSTRHGFTLIEVLLTTVLAAVLLVALWSLLSMYSKTFETGQSRTEQAQLARTLLEQMSIDLQNVVHRPPAMPDLPVLEPPAAAGQGSTSPTAPGSTISATSTSSSPTSSASASSSASSPGVSSPQTAQPLEAQTTTNPTPAMPTAAPVTSAPAAQSPAAPSGNSPAPASTTVMTTSLRPAGLFGSDAYLQIDVVQPPFVEPQTTDDTDLFEEPEPPVGEELAESRAADLKTIVYSFEELRNRTSSASEPIWCLFRRELDWEQAHPAAGGAAAGSSSEELPTAAEALETSGQSADPASPEFDPLLVDDSMASVPEVVYFAIRYFDGAAWSTDWDSIERGGLPQAVEVALRLRSHDEPEVPEVPAEAGVDAERLAELRHPLYRVVIHMTGNVAPPPSAAAASGSLLEADADADVTTSLP